MWNILYLGPNEDVLNNVLMSKFEYDKNVPRSKCGYDTWFAG
jgi:hypothetical protein